MTDYEQAEAEAQTQEAESMNETIPVEAVPQTQAVEIRKAGAVGQALPANQIKAPMTAAQAKVDAVAALTMAAYEKAATLDLTPEEAAKLQADFPDEAFQPGAAGKEHLIYIEHAYLRDRFNSVFGMGKWAIVPRNRWAEAFRTKPNRDNPEGQEGSRVYVEAMLVVRGCFVGEAVGAMEYYPHNASQNYGDAVEGAKTAAFRRCAKEFGVGLQAWKKEFCEAWWRRRRGGRDFSKKPPQNAPGGAGSAPPPQRPTPTPKAAQAPSQPPAPPAPARHLKPATAETRSWMIQELKARPGDPNRDIVTDYFRKLTNPTPLAPFEELETLPLRFAPITKDQLRALADKIAAFGNGEQAGHAFPANPETDPPRPAPKQKPVEVPRGSVDKPEDAEAWRSFPMPWGAQAGVVLDELDKKYLYGLWANVTVETEYKGHPIAPEKIAKAQLFRDMLDAAGEHYEFTKKD